MFDAKQLGAMLGSMQDTIKDLQEQIGRASCRERV